MTDAMQKILFVCTGNICRSPSAEAVLRHMVKKSGLSLGALEIDSAGTHGYHVGEPSDSRAIAHAAKRGIDMTGITARKVAPDDFDQFDLIVAMDRSHFTQLDALRPAKIRGELVLFTDFMERSQNQDVPDPYYGGAEGFDNVLDMLEEGCGAILDRLAL